MLDEDLKQKISWADAFNNPELLRAVEAAARASHEMSETIRLATEGVNLPLVLKRCEELQGGFRRVMESMDAPMRQARLATEAFRGPDIQLFREAAVHYEAS